MKLREDNYIVLQPVYGITSTRLVYEYSGTHYIDTMSFTPSLFKQISNVAKDENKTFHGLRTLKDAESLLKRCKKRKKKTHFWSGDPYIVRFSKLKFNQKRNKKRELLQHIINNEKSF